MPLERAVRPSPSVSDRCRSHDKGQCCSRDVHDTGTFGENGGERRGPLAQRQSSGLLIHWFRVRIPGGPPDRTEEPRGKASDRSSTAQADLHVLPQSLPQNHNDPPLTTTIGTPRRLVERVRGKRSVGGNAFKRTLW